MALYTRRKSEPSYSIFFEKILTIKLESLYLFYIFVVWMKIVRVVWIFFK